MVNLNVDKKKTNAFQDISTENFKLTVTLIGFPTVSYEHTSLILVTNLEVSLQLSPTMSKLKRPSLNDKVGETPI